MCKEKEGVNTLLTELENFHGWDDKIFQGSMADFAHLPTRIDAIILALGNSGDKSVIPKLLKLVEKLDSNVTLSHHRSLALALEKLSDERAAQPLAELLKKTGMKGHSMINIKDAFTDLQNDGKGLNPIKNSSLRKRTNALREIVLARALFKCGDHNKMAEKILTCYTNDMRGLFARHAQSILLNAQNKQ
jgi:hypothetical protein